MIDIQVEVQSMVNVFFSMLKTRLISSQIRTQIKLSSLTHLTTLDTYYFYRCKLIFWKLVAGNK